MDQSNGPTSQDKKAEDRGERVIIEAQRLANISS